MRNIINMCAIALTAFSLQTIAGEQVDKSLAVDGATNISVENLRGKVKIVGWNKDEVAVVGEIDDKAERFIFEKDGAFIKVKVVMPHHMKSSWHEKGSNLVINVPTKLRLDFQGVSTDVIVEGLAKSTEVKTVSGNIELDALSELIEVSSVSGDITSKHLSGKINLSSVSGDIDDEKSAGRISLKAVSGHLKTSTQATEVFVNTVSGDIDMNLDKVDELLISTVSGDVEGELSLNDNGLIKMSSVSGDISLGFTNDVQASFRMKSNAGGDLVNKITNDKAKHAKYGPSSKLYFSTGNGKASVKASTVSGRLKVFKK
ncbi:DUF4097 family beta strand repeat-containing protein [Colwellia sp. 1_MG-2023]|uniref:DUF4097 family beta strand repeat-containing protein n=1 Tax=Colwellia sp. 1_MG-2023 TaxID=3062649 RepID=UPI0026E41B26|nr:DUF4097 family beta strand repeat-containing protein [Colwellia sp. 1_MG-2023]MDO6445167.1 DUF4097 family beta strand repeat-containing protein [Colwellia sp. 1_MG-2023]